MKGCQNLFQSWSCDRAIEGWSLTTLPGVIIFCFFWNLKLTWAFVSTLLSSRLWSDAAYFTVEKLSVIDHDSCLSRCVDENQPDILCLCRPHAGSLVEVFSCHRGFVKLLSWFCLIAFRCQHGKLASMLTLAVKLHQSSILPFMCCLHLSVHQLLIFLTPITWTELNTDVKAHKDACAHTDTPHAIHISVDGEDGSCVW